ncbi:MAG: riboflavin synthase [Pseudomonadales bacterium]|nr:riboflavin synthase [Pseudomonadales bacterium]
MFTGIVAATGEVAGLQQLDAEWRLTIRVGKLDMSDVKLGDSIAVNGCCLTVVTMDSSSFAADVSNESLRCTSLGGLSTGDRVNLEKAMLATDRFGGHIVSGHVDGVGELLSQQTEGKSIRLDFSVPQELQYFIAAKGSICIDGTSLTVNEVNGAGFAVNIIPHTQDETIIGDYRIGQQVNLEVDLVARYLERLMQNPVQATPALNRDFLRQHGYDKE